MQIRPSDELDHDALWAIIEPIARAGETWAIPRDWTRDDALHYWRAPTHEAWAADRGVAGARDMVGTYFLRPAQLGSGSHVANAGHMVRTDAWGSGVAGAMCDHSIARARERGFTAIQFNFVVSTNTRAIALWERKGFRIIGRSPGAYMPGAGKFEGIAITGYDNGAGEYQCTWIDSFGTAMMIGSGRRLADGKSVETNFTYFCPVRGRRVPVRQIITHDSADQQTHRMWANDMASDTEYLMMEAVYTRAK